MQRRNLSPDDFRMIVGRMYNRTKKTYAEAGASKKSRYQNDTAKPKRTRNTIAEQTGVSPSTKKRI